MSSQQIQRQRAPQAEAGLATVVWNGGTQFVRTYPKISVSYFLGIALCLLGTGFAPSHESIQLMDAKFDEVERQYGKSLDDAYDEMQRTYESYYAAQGYFWSCDTKCQRMKEAYHNAKLNYEDIKSRVTAGEMEARKAVGLFSTFGVEKARELFWRMFSKGKSFAKRQSMWDALFMGIGAMARDEQIGAYIVRLIMSVFFNITLGLIGAFIAFVWNLWEIVQAFGADLFTGVAFFTLASLAAASFCVSVMLGIVGTTAGTVYAVGMSAQARLDQTHEQRRNQLPRGFFPPDQQPARPHDD